MTCDDCSDEDGWQWCKLDCPCHCHDDDGSDDELDDAPCIGAECCNQHVDHRHGECVTAEQMAAYHADGEASAENGVKS